MKISIITVIYNGKSTLGDTIKSVLSQHYSDIEFVIIDGGSKDGSIELVKSFGNRIHKFLSEPDEGIYDAMNKGLKLATGDVIGILNADDFYSNDQVIEKVMQLFNTTPVDAVYGDLVYVHPLHTEKVQRYWKAGNYKAGRFLYGWMPPHPSFFVRKAVYDKYGLFNTTLKSAADYEIMLRFIHKYNIRLAYLPEILVRMRSGGVSNASLKNRSRANKEDQLAWKLNNLRPYFFTHILKPVRKISQFLIKSK